MKRNLNYYNLLEQQPWPFDDTASLIDDAGQRLPHDLLADLYLLFPNSAGSKAFVSAITVSTRLVTLTILSTADAVRPLATISLLQPGVQAGRQYALESQYAGAGGWVVFGSGIREDTRRTYRFSTPAQSVLTLQAARRYRPAPVSSIGKLFAETGLTGIVRLSGGDDIEIVKEEREINGVVRDAAVVRLRDKLETGGRNLFDLYRATCDRRPESGNCGDPDPIEFLNNVAPDCCGRIYVELRGCATISTSQTDGCGVQLDCGFGLDVACVSADRLPTADGTLPNEYADQCISISEDVD